MEFKPKEAHIEGHGYNEVNQKLEHIHHKPEVTSLSIANTVIALPYIAYIISHLEVLIFMIERTLWVIEDVQS